ncbi:4301_t:CDS:2, partial [Ambispora gerdemannii]
NQKFTNFNEFRGFGYANELKHPNVREDGAENELSVMKNLLIPVTLGPKKLYAR